MPITYSSFAHKMISLPMADLVRYSPPESLQDVARDAKDGHGCGFPF